MDSADDPADQLVARMASPGVRHRTGLIVLAPAELGHEAELAARLGVDYADYRLWLLRRMSPEQRFLGLTWDQLVSLDLKGIAKESQPRRSCVLVSNLDLALASLDSRSRDEFWVCLRDHFRPSAGLLLTIPAANRRLISQVELNHWQVAERLAALS